MNKAAQTLTDPQPKEWRSRVAAILAVLVLLAPARAGRTAEKARFNALFPVGIDHEFSNPQETFTEVRQLILTHYYTKEITEEALYWAAIRGMLRHISPPNTPELSKIWPAAAYEKILSSLKGEQVSIGIKSRFNPDDGSLTVTETLPGSPSDTVLKPLDRILRVNGGALKGKSLEKVNALLSAEVGEKITLTVNRDIEVFEVTIVCRKFKSKDLIITRLSDTIAMIEIKHFTAGMADKLKTGLDRLKVAGVEGLIIDLRNNPGGVFLDALKTAELFLPKNRILMRALTRDTDLKNYVSVNPDPFEFSTAILANRKTASSSEIVASALQDHQRAIIIGTRTFGKGIFEKTFDLKNRMWTKFITGAMYSPKGNTWHGKGLTPDFLVRQDDKTLETLLKLDPVQRAGKDVSIITALKLLRRSGS